MSFVNELIPAADKKECGISDSYFYRAGTRQLTVCRERGNWLVFRAGYGSEGSQDEKFCAFYWNDCIVDVHIRTLGVRDANDGCLRSLKRIVDIKGIVFSSNSERGELLADLKKALTTYGVAGLAGPVISYELDLEVKYFCQELE